MPSVKYIEIDHDNWVGNDDDHITIEGADELVGRIAKKHRVKDTRDYLGIGRPEVFE